MAEPNQNQRRVLITGITGQDGAYLAKFLLDKGYEVFGGYRRLSTPNFWRLQYLDIFDKVKLIPMDLIDANSIYEAIQISQPDEIYHLGAQSFVGASFEEPSATAQITGVSATLFLEAIRLLNKKIKFYQASTSELYGDGADGALNENSPFKPSSPYAAAKLYAYWMTKIYRDGYGIFAANGILFNHETITSFMPMFFKKSNEKELDIKPIREIVEFDESKQNYQSKPITGIQVWGKNGWVDVSFASAYPHDIKTDNKQPKFINSRAGAFMATSSHVVFMDGGEEKKVEDIRLEDQLEIIELPDSVHDIQSLISQEEAELMGMMVGDGSISYARKNHRKTIHGKFTNSSEGIRARFDYLWLKVTGGHTVYYPSKSGFNPERIVGQLILAGGNEWLRKIDIYNNDRTKRVPKVILNSSPDVMMAFLMGYNVCDGLKENPCVYEFRNFKTNSATLAMGLWYLIDKTTKQDINLTLETKDDGRIFYSLNILSTVDNILKEQRVQELISAGVSQRETSRITTISRTFIRKIQNGGVACPVHHLRKDSLEVKKILDIPDYQGWFYDLQTSSGEFHCGVGKCHVHNSPLRGLEFVTRKISNAVAKIFLGLEKELILGNLEAKRDWGYAPEYVESMWMMLQQPEPDDYVIATGENHTVKEFVDESFKTLGLDSAKYIKTDPRFSRKVEVTFLLGDYSKAKEKLGWEPKTKFNDLVKIMVNEDLNRWKKWQAGEKFAFDAIFYPGEGNIMTRALK